MVAAVFLLKRVQGMPPIRGGDPLETAAAYPTTPHGLNELSKRLPQGYFARFGQDAWTFVMSRVRADHTLAEEVLSDFTLRLLSTGVEAYSLREGAPLKDAKNFVLKSLKRQAVDAVNKRKRRNRREIGDHITDDEGQEAIREIAVAPDVETILDTMLDNFDSRLVERLLESPDTRRKLDRVHPQAQLYVELIKDKGITDKKFLEEVKPLTLKGKPFEQANWSFFRKNILNVLREQAEKLV